MTDRQYILARLRWRSPDEGDPLLWCGVSGSLAVLDLGGENDAGTPGDAPGALGRWAIQVLPAAATVPTNALALGSNLRAAIDGTEWRRRVGVNMPSDVTLSEAVGLSLTRFSDPNGAALPGTLRPRLGGYRVVIGGVEVWSARIRQLTDDRPVLIERARAIARMQKQRSQAGEHISRVDGRWQADPLFYRRLLTEAARNLEVNTSVIADHPDDTPLPRGTRYDDDFSSGGSDPSAFELTWTALVGSISTSAGICYSFSNPARYRADHDVGGDVHEAAIDFVNVGTPHYNTQVGACVRYSSSADTCIQVWSRKSNGSNSYKRISKIVSGTETVLSDTAGQDNTSSPWEIKATVDAADLITLFVRGVSAASTTDSTGAGNTRGGMRLRDAGSGNPQGDDFYIDDNDAGGGGTLPSQLAMRGAG